MPHAISVQALQATYGKEFIALGDAILAGDIRLVIRFLHDDEEESRAEASWIKFVEYYSSHTVADEDGIYDWQKTKRTT
jgi:hypothetical protein